MIARLTHTKLKIDSQEGDVIITGDSGLDVYNAKQIINAIGRGFTPDQSLTLLNDENIFEVIKITDYSRNIKNDLHRLKARLIGREGTAKHTIEYLANVLLSVYGKTVCILGRVENVDTARHAINNLLTGSRHGKVYAYLERQRNLKETEKWQK